ncbi:MAG: efflux RND transporter permease subunit, partial [Pseudomonadota bacterium]
LTLTPVLCRAVLRQGSGGMLERGVNWTFSWVEGGYRRVLRAVLGWPLIVVAVAAVIGASAWQLYQEVPQELAPREDRGVFFVAVSAPQGATTGFTDREVREVERRLAPLSESGEAERIFSIIGFRRLTHRAFVVVRLSDWDQRERHSAAIVQSLFGPMTSIPGARAFPIQPTGLGLRGSRTPLQVKVLGPDFDSVREWSILLLDRLRENPNLRNLDTDYERTQPEVRVQIDRALADDLGVAVEDVAATLQTFFAGREATQWIDRGREYPVILQAREAARATADDLGEMYVRSRSTQRLIPLSALLTTSEGAATPELNRFNRLPAIEISGSTNDGYAIGQAIQDV